MRRHARKCRFCSFPFQSQGLSGKQSFITEKLPGPQAGLGPGHPGSASARTLQTSEQYGGAPQGHAHLPACIADAYASTQHGQRGALLGCAGRMTFTPGNASLSAPRAGKQTRCPWSKGLPWSISPFQQGRQQPSTRRILGPRSPALALGGTPSHRWQQVLLIQRHLPGARLSPSANLLAVGVQTPGRSSRPGLAEVGC